MSLSVPAGHWELQLHWRSYLASGHLISSSLGKKQHVSFKFIALISLISFGDVCLILTVVNQGREHLTTCQLGAQLILPCTHWSLLVLHNASVSQNTRLSCRPLSANGRRWINVGRFLLANHRPIKQQPVKHEPPGIPSSGNRRVTCFRLISSCGDDSFYITSDVSFLFTSGFSGDFQTATSPKSNTSKEQ